MTRFVILTTQRSGSVMLIQSLSSHPDIVCFGEIFLHGARYGRNMSVPPGRENFLYEEFIRVTSLRRLRSIIAPRGCAAEFLETFFRRQDDKPAAGFKLMYSQVRGHPGAWDWVLDRDVRIIHLVREDLLRVVLSRRMRTKTGVAHSADQVAATSFRIDPAELLRQLDARARNLARFRELLEGREDTIEVGYERLLADERGEFGRLLDFIGVPKDLELQSGVTKQKVRPLREIIRNYDEVLAAIRGTSHFRFFEE